MSKITVSSIFGTVQAKELALVDIHEISASIRIPDATMEQTGNQGDQSPTTSDSFSQRGVVEGDECPF